MILSEIVQKQVLTGVEPAGNVTVVAVETLGEEMVTLTYKRADGALRERLVTGADAATFSPAAGAAGEWTFDAAGADFKLVLEAKRMDLAFLFDPLLAVHTSNVEPLPHQITAVYESLLPRTPLRFVLADDPGAGKTIMAGLYMSELLLRADARRVLVVAPGSLVEQWREELWEKFGLRFTVFSRDNETTTGTGNFFADNNLIIARLDQLARDEVVQEGVATDEIRQPGPLQTKAIEAGWDLVVFDEAHKLAAHADGEKISRTGRFRFAERIGAKTRHLLLMTATPHNGKEGDFQLFLSLLDSDRFYGRFRNAARGAHTAGASDLFRRLTKEKLVRFDGTPLFPERRANTLNYTLTAAEVELYNAVTNYVVDEMGKADSLDGKRKGSIGLALTTLQRRVASSPEAIWQSLRNRRERLQKRLRECEIAARGTARNKTFDNIGNAGSIENSESIEEESAAADDDDLSADERERLENELVDRATAASSLPELRAEIEKLEKLEKQARELRDSGVDKKWDELSRLLQSREPELRDADGRLRKLIIFTEHRATLDYLKTRINSVLGGDGRVETIHGGTLREERQRVQAEFRSDKDVRVLVATDAAGEGVNLQCANLMVNYDLPWNPNRLEQRFGRIHRIGQTEVCHLWNLVARETREGDVYFTLLQKLEQINKAFDGRVFDILGEVFEDKPLKDMLLEAIRYGGRAETRERMERTIDDAFDEQKVRDLLNRNALSTEVINGERLFSIKQMLDEAEAKKLQPYFVKAYFMEAFRKLGGTIYERERGRFEITHVPAALRERDRLLSGRNRRDTTPVLQRYERVCFEKEFVPAARTGGASAVLLHPGHPLFLAITDTILEKHAALLRKGTVFIDDNDAGDTPSQLFVLAHEIRYGKSHATLSKRLQFVRCWADGRIENAGEAPHLDLRIATPDIPQTPNSKLSTIDLENAVLARAATELAPRHFEEVKARHCERVEKTLDAVHERLTAEIAFWTDRHERLAEDNAAGKDVRLPLSDVEKRVNDLQSRLDLRRQELLYEKHVTQVPPVVLGGALVLPAGLVKKHKANGASNGAGNIDDTCANAADAGRDTAAAGTGTTPEPDVPLWAQTPEARRRIELAAMEAVMQCEREHGCTVEDVSARKCGWDITSIPPPDATGKHPLERHIEVKGRAAGARTISVTRNEMLYALNQREKFHLAIVFVNEDGSTATPLYKRAPFTREPDPAVTSATFDIAELAG
jgi:superfamily II DNA or RNA helicase